MNKGKRFIEVLIVVLLAVAFLNVRSNLGTSVAAAFAAFVFYIGYLAEFHEA